MTEQHLEPKGLTVTVESENGKRWKLVGPHGRWTMQPEGEITAPEAEQICRGFAAYLDATASAGEVEGLTAGPQIDAAYRAASAVLPAHADIGAGELDRVVRAALAASGALDGVAIAECGWQPIETADKSITVDMQLSPDTPRLIHSYPIWVRCEGGEPFEASWCQRKPDKPDGYWWAWDAEEVVDPDEWMPHPLAAALSTASAGDVEYTEGICADGAAILCDGDMMTVSEILAALNDSAAQLAARDARIEQAAQFMLTAFKRMRAAHIGCADMERELEQFLSARASKAEASAPSDVLRRRRYWVYNYLCERDHERGFQSDATERMESAADIAAALSGGGPVAVKAEPVTVADAETAKARAAAVICEVGALCGWPRPDCKSREAAQALFDAGLLAAPQPTSGKEKNNG